MYTTTLKRTRKVSARDEAHDRLEARGWHPNAIRAHLRHLGDLLDHEVEVTEDVEVQHRFKVGDWIDVDRRRWCVAEVCSPRDHSLDWDCDAIYHLTSGGDYELLDTRIVDKRAALASPRTVYTLTIERREDRCPIGLHEDSLREHIESYDRCPAHFHVTNITSEVAS